jgi:hypothetical protein
MNPLIMIAPIKFNLLRRPLWPAEVAEVCLDIPRRQLLAMMESGELPWAWDLSNGTVRNEIRILAASVVEKSSGPLTAIGATRNLNLAEVVNLILPQKRATLRSVEVQRLFHVSPDLVADLHASGEIERLAEVLPATGPNASPRYTRASLANLLKKRRMT